MLSPLRNGGIVLGVSWSECKYLSFPAEEPSEVLQVWLSLAQCHYSPPSRETGVGGLENLRRWSRAFGSLKRLGSVSERANVTFYVTKSAFCSHPCFGTWAFSQEHVLHTSWRAVPLALSNRPTLVGNWAQTPSESEIIMALSWSLV